MAFLTRDAILSAADLKTQSVPVPEWGGDVLVRVLSGAERDQFEHSVTGGKRDGALDLRNLRARYCSLVLCDDKGKRLFTEGDVAALGAKSAAALDRVYEAARRHNGMDAKAVEEAEKNSAPTPGGASS